eukprot:COSAG02_NODE_3285_length_7007_cov_4.103503_7_plen_128_part_01
MYTFRGHFPGLHAPQPWHSAMSEGPDARACIRSCLPTRSLAARLAIARAAVLPPELKHTTPPPTSAATMTTKPSVAEAVPPTPVAPRLAIQTVTGQQLAVDDAIRTDTLARLRARISLTHGIAAGTQR